MTRDRKKGSGKAAAKKPRVKKETVKDLEPKGDVKGGAAHTDLCPPGHLLNPPPDLRRTV